MTYARDAKQRLARGVRRQRGTALLPSYLADAGAVIGQPLALSDVLPLEATDRFFDLYSEVPHEEERITERRGGSTEPPPRPHQFSASSA